MSTPGIVVMHLAIENALNSSMFCVSRKQEISLRLETAEEGFHFCIVRPT
jgi:hypothetical protein